MNPSTAPIPGYTLQPRELERWRDGHLSMRSEEGGAIEATFRFEGATCSGIPLTMIYQVTLGPAGEGYPIQAMACHPASDTDGHERMCSYLHTSGRILQIANDEKPLLGQPLEAVMSWRPKTYAAGCLCATPSRDHKWAAVLQTLHFALQPPAKF
jgi:hypothetical protein